MSARWRTATMAASFRTSPTPCRRATWHRVSTSTRRYTRCVIKMWTHTFTGEVGQQDTISDRMCVCVVFLRLSVQAEEDGVQPGSGGLRPPLAGQPPPEDHQQRPLHVSILPERGGEPAVQPTGPAALARWTHTHTAPQSYNRIILLSKSQLCSVMCENT